MSERLRGRTVKRRNAVMRIGGAAVAYGCLAAFILLIGVQTYRWFRDGEWTHIGISDGLLALLTRCCVRDGATGLIAHFAQWLDAPQDWLGWHKLLDTVPASIGLFFLSVIGNFIHIYGSDHRDEQP